MEAFKGHAEAVDTGCVCAVASGCERLREGSAQEGGVLVANDDGAVYCSFSETNFVYLWEGYVLQTERCDKNSGLSPSRGLCSDSHPSGPCMC